MKTARQELNDISEEQFELEGRWQTGQISTEEYTEKDELLTKRYNALILQEYEASYLCLCGNLHPTSSNDNE